MNREFSNTSLILCTLLITFGVIVFLAIVIGSRDFIVSEKYNAQNFIMSDDNRTQKTTSHHENPVKINKDFWRFFSTSNPSLYDAFSREQTFYADLQVKRHPCERCRLDDGRLLLDFDGAVMEAAWKCRFSKGSYITNGDPDGNVAVIKCIIPDAVQNFRGSRCSGQR